MSVPDTIQNQFANTRNFSELWDRLHEALRPFGVTSIFLGFGHSRKSVDIKGIMEPIWSKTSHPKEYCAYYADKYYIDDDLSSLHCLHATSPFLWHDFSAWGTPTLRQKRFMHESWDFNMGVGVTIPLRFNNNTGIGGIGMATAEMTPDEFDAMWDKHSSDFLEIVHCFKEQAFQDYNFIFQLSPRELEILTLLSQGLVPSEIAARLGTSISTVGHQIRNARKKLQAVSNEHAVARAIFFSVIQDH